MSESFATPPRSEQHARYTSRNSVFCPRCGTIRTQAKNRAKRFGGTLGTCLGVANSLSGIIKGTTTGAAISLRIVGHSTPMNSITAAALGALAGGAIGCASGAALGQVIDETVLNNHLCLRCGHSFPTL